VEAMRYRYLKADGSFMAFEWIFLGRTL